MFSGIIAGTGTVSETIVINDGVRLVVAPPEALAGAELGASIAVNGVCLTVAGNDSGRLSFDAVGATLKRTRIGGLAPGDRINLEPALALGDSVDGHLVTGHVDGLGSVILREPGEGAEYLTFAAPGMEKQLAERGSVAVDGVSLTIAAVQGAEFTVSLVPFTLERTTLSGLKAGDPVHIETDVLAKYVQRVLEFA